MKGKKLLFTILSIIIVCLLIWKRDNISQVDSVERKMLQKDDYKGTAKELVRTKSDRSRNKDQIPQQASTHTPERLSDFFLPPDLLIENLTLQQALQVLKTSYEDTCYEIGETPLKLTFNLPDTDNGQLISTRLNGTFTNAIQYLALLARMEMTRNGTTYQFTHPDESLGKSITKEHTVPSNILSLIAKNYIGDPTELENLPPLELAKALGIQLAPTTQIAFLKGASRIIVRSGNTFDHEILSNLIENASSPGKQFRFSTKTVALSPDVNIELPKFSPISADDLEHFMREVSSLPGVNISSLPSVVARNGEPAKVEIVRGLPTKPDSNTKPLTAGITLDIESNRIGFGQDSSFHFQHTQFARPSKHSPPEEIVVEELLNSEQAVYGDNQDTSVMLETHPDGSRTLVLVTTSEIDTNDSPKGVPLSELNSQ